VGFRKKFHIPHVCGSPSPQSTLPVQRAYIETNYVQFFTVERFLRTKQNEKHRINTRKCFIEFIWYFCFQLVCLCVCKMYFAWGIYVLNIISIVLIFKSRIPYPFTFLCFILYLLNGTAAVWTSVHIMVLHIISLPNCGYASKFFYACVEGRLCIVVVVVIILELYLSSSLPHPYHITLFFVFFYVHILFLSFYFGY
jgi:hypothetical protein